MSVSQYSEFVSSLSLRNHNNFMHLQILPETPELVELYQKASTTHNNKIINEPFYDSGFDLYLPDEIFFPTGSISNKVDFKIKCSATTLDLSRNTTTNTGYYLYARSSISKTPLRVANNQGIIDSGYRGSIIGVLDNISQNTSYEAKKGDRLMQICAPNLMPIYVSIVTDLGEKTSRGEGGFGSTNGIK